jgi:PAS domain S-box-containing protein
MEDSQRSALLFMLEDLENARQKIEHAHQEWKSALDVVNDPIFLHDKQFRILRCNKAYQQRAGIPFHELVGQPYYEVFPKNHEPLPSCLRVMENAVAVAVAEEEVLVGDAIYRSRAFSIHDEQGAYLHSVHILEDITERKRAKSKLVEQVEELRRWHDATLGREMRTLELKREVNEMLGQAGQPRRYPSAESDDLQEK